MYVFYICPEIELFRMDGNPLELKVPFVQRNLCLMHARIAPRIPFRAVDQRCDAFCCKL